VLERRTSDAFRTRPEGGFVAGEAWLYFCADASLHGFVLWEVPSEKDMDALVRLMEAELTRREPHVAYVDVRRLRVALAPSFAALARYFVTHAEALARVVTRGAIVRGEGITAAIAAGFMATVPTTFSASTWTDPVRALEHLGLRPERARALAEALDRACEEAAGTPHVLASLQGWLEQHLEGSTLEDAARGLATAPRTLQRRLSEAGTSFVDELGKARVRVAQRMMLASDVPISNVALDVGCASPQHFASLFKKHVGETPTAWRQRMARG
jgi:transcriptional regulator GlxA family with amidase domain